MNSLFIIVKKHKLRVVFSIAFFVFLFAFASTGIFATDYYLEGENLFRKNNPAEAIPYLQQALTQPDVNPNVFIYLGLCYYQEGLYDDAVTTFVRGTLANGADTKALFFNAGNVYFEQELFQQAEDMYTRSIHANNSYPPAFLNRANTRIKLEKLDEAVQDYSTYLTLNPASWQKDSIMYLISLINQETKKPDKGPVSVPGASWAQIERSNTEYKFQQLINEIPLPVQDQNVEGASIFSTESERVMIKNEGTNILPTEPESVKVDNKKVDDKKEEVKERKTLYLIDPNSY